MVDGMEFLQPGPERRAMHAHRMAEFEQRLRRCDLPLVGLADPAPSPRMVAETGGSDGGIDDVGLAYGDLMRPDGPLVQVHTARRSTETIAPNLADLLEQELDRVEDDTEVAEGGVEHTELVIDGVPHPATVQRHGDRFWAARTTRAGTDVTVVARDWDLAAIRLVTVPSIEPFLRGRAEVLAAAMAAGPPALPEPVEVEHPHRALVDAVLAEHLDMRQRVRAGRRPRARGARRIAGLWQAAVRAQEGLADQSADDANDAVTTMINQLSDLQEKADWFADARLREAAVTETLMYWTGLREAVPSQPAQDLWRRYWQARRALRPESWPLRPLAARSRYRDLLGIEVAWLDAWSEWARAREVTGE